MTLKAVGATEGCFFAQRRHYQGCALRSESGKKASAIHLLRTRSSLVKDGGQR